jgi:CheY-like chemotaxis protein
MHILIIEDNPDLAANVCDFLEAKGHSTDAAGDGLTGLHLAVTPDYDAIVLDVMLPGMDGFTLRRRLREEARRDTPVLMLTALTRYDHPPSAFADVVSAWRPDLVVAGDDPGFPGGRHDLLTIGRRSEDRGLLRHVQGFLSPTGMPGGARARPGRLARRVA